MKKVFLFLSAISLVAVSCSSDDDSPTNPDPGSILVKREVYQQAGVDGFNFTTDYTYNGNKIVKEVSNDGYVANYFYTGDLITKVDWYLDGTLDEREIMTYDSNGKLIGYSDHYMENATPDEYTFVYNSDNTVTKTQVGTNFTTTLTFANGELSQIVQSGGTTYTYTYDAKNSPFKNITGYAEIAYIIAGDNELHGRSRNIVSIVDETNQSNYMMNSFVYNADGYPTQVLSTANFFENQGPSEQLTVTYTY